jgi:phage shock protein C
MTKRLYRSRQHRVFAGVCGGLGEYFDVDPVFIRVMAAILVLVHGIGLIAYLIAWIAMPKAPLTTASPEPESGINLRVEINPPSEPSALRLYLPGLIFIIVGIIFLMDHFFWWFHWHHVWPVLLILAGVAIIWRSYSHNKKNGGINESFES